MYIDDQTGALIEARVLVTRARQRQIDVQGLLCPAERADPSRPTGGEHEIHEPCEIRGRQPPHQAERRRAHLLHRAQHTLDRWQPVPIDAADDGLGHLHGTRRPARCGQRGHGAGASLLDERLAGTSVRRQPPRRVSSARATRRPCRLIARVAPRTPFGGGGTDIDTTPGTAGAVIAGEGGHEPRPRAPAACRPSHSRPGGRVPRPCRLATCQKGRVARIVDDTGLIAIDVDRSVWLDARGEDVPGQLVGPVQRAWVHGPVRTVGREHRPNSRSVHVHSVATRGSPHIAVPSPPHISLPCAAHQSECGRTPLARGHHQGGPSP